MNRRTLLTAGMLGSVSVVTGESLPAIGKIKAKKKQKLGISSYSYWHFRPPKVKIETVIDKASALGVEGVDILHRQMDSEESSYLSKLKRHAFLNGIDLICLSIHQDFVSPDPKSRERNIEHTKKCIRIAHDLGIPCIRLNSGTWGTVRGFSKLMELRGQEPVLEGYTLDDGFNWCIDLLLGSTS